MKEAVFLDRNAEKWRSFESDLGEERIDPDRLSHIYVELSDDLAYARTFFPEGRSEEYLNDLTAHVHHRIHRNKKERKGRILTFWTQELPELLSRVQKELFLAALIFLLSVLIGIFSQAFQPSFADVILGKAYVNETLQNIEEGEPMAIYRTGGAFGAFLGFTVNNVRVALLTFVFGAIFSVGTGFILFRNGILLGTFFTLFHQHGEDFEAMTTVWLHGTLEIAAIIVSGCAGLVMGNAFLYPGSYSRWSSFGRGAKKGLKVAIGTVPFILVAAFIEGFITRQLWLSPLIKVLIILLSLLFAVHYFVLLPKRIASQR